MDRVTRCLHCGKRMVPAPGLSGRTELICVYCNKADSLDLDPAANPVDRLSPRPALQKPFRF